MVTDRELQALFSQPAFVGPMLRYGAFLDYDVDCLLVLYFIRSDRIDQGLELLIPELTFGRKIEILRRLPLKHTQAHAKALTGLRSFQRIRNMAAHSWSISLTRCRELLHDSHIRELFSDYPRSLDGGFKVTRRRLRRLRQSKAFGPQARSASKEMDERTLLRVLTDHAA